MRCAGSSWPYQIAGTTAWVVACEECGFARVVGNRAYAMQTANAHNTPIVELPPEPEPRPLANPPGLV